MPPSAGSRSLHFKTSGSSVPMGRIVGKTQLSIATIVGHTLLQKCAVNDEIFIKLKLNSECGYFRTVCIIVRSLKAE